MMRLTTAQQKVDKHPRMPHVRLNRFLTLLGSLIVFVTFIAKEGVSDNLKDLVSSIETAENLFTLRQETTYRVSSEKSLPPPWSEKEPTRDEQKGFIDLWDRQSESIVRISLDLAVALPDEKLFQKRASRITDTLWTIDQGVDNLRGAQQTEAQSDAALKDFFRKSNETFSDANLLGQDILDEANRLKNDRQKFYEIAKWTSYALFTLGWSLTFYGQLSSKEELTRNKIPK
jgi:hypothetical protein